MSRNLRAVSNPSAQGGVCRIDERSDLIVALDASEREILTILRRKIAKKLDEPATPAHTLAALVKQFRDVDSRIRDIDERANQAAAREREERTEQRDRGPRAPAAFDPTAI